MLERNMKVKEAPQKWHTHSHTSEFRFDIVVTYEERVYDAVIEGQIDPFASIECFLTLMLNSLDMQARWSTGEPVLLILLPTKDNHEAALLGATYSVQLATLFEKAASESIDWRDQVDEVVLQFEQKHKQKAIYSLLFY